MKKIHIFNGAQPYPFAKGELNAAFDVMKDPTIESDFERFEAHLKSVFA